LNIKSGFIIVLFTSFFSTGNFKKVLCSHPWKAEYIKTIHGTHDPYSKLPVSEMHNTPPLCGQSITFKEDSTCLVQNRGQGWWSEVDKYNWSIDDSSGNLKFRNKGSRFQYQFGLRVLSFNEDSIIFYTPNTSFEGGHLSVTVYKLKKVKV